MLVKETCKLANMGASKLKKFLISNWSKGLVIVKKKKWDIIKLIVKHEVKKNIYDALHALHALHALDLKLKAKILCKLIFLLNGLTHYMVWSVSYLYNLT